MTKHGFTLMELLIITALLGLVISVAIVLINPWLQIAKARDARRKSDLSAMQKALEDWYNDKGCYPKPSEICYDASTDLKNVCPKNGNPANVPILSLICHICGSEETSPLFSPYMKPLPCDPEHPAKKYLYETNAKSGFMCTQAASLAVPDCPNWARIYSDFSNENDASEECTLGACGIGYDPNTGQSTTIYPLTTPYPFGYDYGVTSPNIILQKTDRYGCLNNQGVCNYCGANPGECENPSKNCKIIYASKPSCCLANPSSSGCN